jgi:hypothetical protein
VEAAQSKIQQLISAQATAARSHQQQQQQELREAQLSLRCCDLEGQVAKLEQALQQQLQEAQQATAAQEQQVQVRASAGCVLPLSLCCMRLLWPSCGCSA